MTRPSGWLTKWIPVLAASLYYVAVLLRIWLSYRESRTLGGALGLLLLWGILAVSEPLVSRRWRRYFPIYLLLQTTLVFVLIALPGTPDFMGALLGVLSMQIMLRLPTRLGLAWIGLWAVIMVLLFWRTYQYEAIALTLIYAAGNVFYGSYTRTIRQAQAARLHNQVLVDRLEQANNQLQEYATRLEQLSAARERNRLARELHDSVTQTVFSMSLTSQSAAILLERDPPRVAGQLERLYALARNALAEMQVLIDELKPEPAAQEGLPAALQRLVMDGRLSGSLNASVEVEGDQPLELSEQCSLLGIAQEALTNIYKHAHTDHARIRLHLDEPVWMEIEDEGRGFDLPGAQRGGHLGLVSMGERATEIGWFLQIVTSPGAGTRIRVEKPLKEEGKHE